ncbi:methyltransferase type 11 [Candidatus Bathyarchaeota archaeon]|nr:MAG: methyltransferase type 11 [Candidatus Bathyarchaeota archaeon]
MHNSVMEWGKQKIEELNLSDKNTLEVGSLNVNGTLRDFFTGDYHGIDIREGEGVDEVKDGSKLRYRGKYDVIVCTEMLEHAEDWKGAINGLKKALKIGGYLLLTARSEGFGKHDYPGDYWRYSVKDMKIIFCDMEAEIIADPQHAGVFVCAKKKSTELRDLSLLEVNPI